MPVGGKVLFSEGQLNIAAKIAWVKNAVHLAGMGRATFLSLNNNVNNHVIEIGDGSTYISGNRVSDMLIDGNKANQTAGSLIHVYSAEHTFLTGLQLTGAKEMGILAEGTASRNTVYVYVAGGYVTSCDGGGVYALNQAYAVNLAGPLVIAGCGTSPAGNGGFRAYLNSDHTITGVLFDENSIGIRMYSCSYTAIDGCSFINQARDGVLLDGGTHHVTVEGGQILSPSNGSADTYSGVKTDGTYNIIKGINIYGLANRIKAGVEELTGADYNLIEGNLIHNSLNGVTIIGANTIVKDNQGFLAPGESRIASGALTAGLANAYAFNWQNPHATKVLIERVMIYISTAGGTANSVLDVGVAAATATHDDTLIDGLNINQTGVFDNINDAGTNGKSRQIVDENGGTNDWVTGQILVADASALVGRYEIKYVGI